MNGFLFICLILFPVHPPYFVADVNALLAGEGIVLDIYGIGFGLLLGIAG